LLERSRSQPKPAAEDEAAAKADYLVTGDKGRLLLIEQAAGVPIIAASDFLRALRLPENPT